MILRISLLAAVAAVLAPLTLAPKVSALPQACIALFSPVEIRPLDERPLFTQNIVIKKELAQALRDPLIVRARELVVEDDFKYLADLIPKELSSRQKQQIQAEAARIQARAGEKAAVSYQLHALYEHRDELLPVYDPSLAPAWTTSATQYRPVIEHIERMWAVLTRRTPPEAKSSLLPLRHPTLIPGARFNEGYYWDTFFVFKALLKTGRERLVRGQIENFMDLMREYGFIPNGTRQYYLDRSQPPLFTQMVRVYVEHEMAKGPLSPSMKKWLKEEVYPLAKKDYDEFWMGERRYDAKTGLNHHWASDEQRPERHSSDMETTSEIIARYGTVAKAALLKISPLGRRYRSVRAEAESGKDFTDAFMGEAENMAPVMLNSMLFQVEKDMAWMADLAIAPADSRFYLKAAAARETAMRKYLWDPVSGVHRDYNLRTGKRSPVITADIFLPLASGLASPGEAEQIIKSLSLLERRGGLMSSEKETGKQWDGRYGWAPQHYFAIEGLKRYGETESSRRLAKKWLDSVAQIYSKTGKIIEKIDVEAGGIPEETGDKYPTQDGFLWSNGVTMYALEEAGYDLVRDSSAQVEEPFRAAQ